MSGFFMPDLMLCTIHFHPRGMAEAESLDVMTQIRSGPKDALSDAYRSKNLAPLYLPELNLSL